MFQTPYNKQFDALMKRPHDLEIGVTLTNGNGDERVDVSDRFMDGNVAVDSTALVTRALDLTLFDPGRRIHLDPGSPQRTSVFIDQRVEVMYTIIDPVTGDRYSCPVFTGGIDDVARDEVFINIKALGMEAHAVNNSWRAKTYKKKQKKTQMLRHLIKNYVGVEAMRIPSLKSLLPNDVKLNREKAPWPLAQKVASTLEKRMLIMDATGTAVVTRKSRRTRFTFTEEWVTTPPKTEYDLSQVVNCVLVLGKKPRRRGNRGSEDSAGRRKRPKYKAQAPKKHPLSPKKLGRNGVPRYLWLIIEDDSLRSVKECRARARQELERGLLAGLDVQFTGIPQPRLQEGDMTAVTMVGFHSKFPMKKWNIPLKAGVDANYGSLQKVPAVSKGKKGK